MTSCDDLIRRIEDALTDNDGEALEQAWYALYDLNPGKAVHVANIMRPLSREKVLV